MPSQKERKTRVVKSTPRFFESPLDLSHFENYQTIFFSPELFSAPLFHIEDKSLKYHIRVTRIQDAPKMELGTTLKNVGMSQGLCFGLDGEPQKLIRPTYTYPHTQKYWTAQNSLQIRTVRSIIKTC